ncbi:M15 family metallopeptidase [Niveibacterium sp.]|uniref:M15 family metallopeptidase n=1 Tax=Niveibacterium sp. TaxID=2017444 RepID=UPI0035AFA903
MELFLGLSALMLVAVLGGSLMCFPALRDAAMRGVQRRVESAGDMQRRLGSSGRDALVLLGAGGGSVVLRAWRWVRSNRLVVGLSLAAVFLPVVAAVLLSMTRPMAGFEDRAEVRDPVLAALLDGEHLVPPPALPPEVFVTAEMQSERPEIATASRDWTLMDGEFRQRVLVLFQQMSERGYELALLEGYRSPERQAELAAMGPNVTRAGAFQSYHQFGLAADLAFFRNGKLVISERDAWAMEGYRLLGERAETLGLTWGGRWKLMDFGHVELRRAGVLGRK